jgi:hypothetical protein
MSLLDDLGVTEMLGLTRDTKREFETDEYVSHHHHAWERQGFVTRDGETWEVYECAECDAWTEIEKPPDTRQQWRLGSRVDDSDEAEGGAEHSEDRLKTDGGGDDEIILHEHDSMKYIGSKGDTLGFLCHCGDVHEIPKRIFREGKP